MGFNPLDEKGRSIDQQFHNWDTLNVQPYDKSQVHPYTRCRIILMTGAEFESVWFGHQFARHTDDADLKRQLAVIRRCEQQQEKMTNWLIPAEESALEVTLGYEQVAVDLTAQLARTEPDQDVKAALDFALIEDFDHLYRYANLLEMTQGRRADQVIGEFTEVFPGRPTVAEHRHPMDSIRKPIGAEADILTKLHVMTIVAGEQQTMNFYMNVGNRAEGMLGRGLYLEIAQIEEQHVSHYESLLNPSASWFERWVMHEYNECYLYYSCMQSEVDQRIKGMWENHLADEIEHLRIACGMLHKYEGRDAREFLPGQFPELTVFQSNKDYVRKIVASQLDLTTRDSGYVSRDDLSDSDRYFQFQGHVNKGSVPSQDVIQKHIQKTGRDYRLETEGPHPVKRLRTREEVTV